MQNSSCEKAIAPLYIEKCRKPYYFKKIKIKIGQLLLSNTKNNLIILNRKKYRKNYKLNKK